MSVIQLPASTVKLITSSQIITSVSGAVKELFENALDAGATSIDVKLVNFGMDRIEVKDNGSGISKENTASMALPHHTSKISSFSDLETLETYGFRGEALNALCKVGQVTLTTASASDPMAMVYTLDSSGNISGFKPSHHVQGTTVLVSNIFKTLPVRRQLMGSSRRAQEELKQVETVVKSLAVIKANIRVTLSHNKCLIWQKTPCSSLQNSFAQLVGYSACQQLELLSVKISEEVCVEMLIPKRDSDINALSKSTPALSLVFVNNRPVTYKKIHKILHEQLAEKFGDKFSTRKFSVCLISINISSSCVDVNLEPNKTKVLLKDEDVLLHEIQQLLQSYYSISINDREITQAPNNLSKDQKVQQHTSPLESDENCTRKKRKIDNSLSCAEREVSDNSITLNESKTSQNIGCIETKLDSCYEVNHFNTKTASEHIVSVGNTSEAFECQGEQIMSHDQDYDVPNMTLVHGKSFPENGACLTQSPEDSLKDQAVFSENQIETQLWKNIESNICFSTSDQNRLAESKSNSQEIPIDKASNLPQSENLWEDASDLNELSRCLDALVSESEPSMLAKTSACDAFVKEVDIIGTEAWSMGHVGLSKGNIAKGSCVLIGGQRAPSDQQNKATATIQQKLTEFPAGTPDVYDPLKTKPSEAVTFLKENSRANPQINPRTIPPQKSPPKSPRAFESNGLSQGLDSSLQSVSSQMGRRELAAFTKFAREVRPQIILENPGIAFTLVASVLAKKWQTLSDDEREHYEKIARETATAKKVWKNFDKKKTLELVRKLSEKKKTVKPSRHDRPPRREVLKSMSMDHIKEQLLTASSSIKRKQQISNDLSIRLLGQLEPSGTWLCLEKSVISLLNHSRLQEVVINRHLLNSHALLLKPLASWVQLNHMVLGEEAWKTLLSLPCEIDEIQQRKIVSADIIVKNGFKIEIQRDNRSAVLTEVAEALNYYGVKELKETLTLARTWPVVQLSECRPLRVINHIEAEAMRICRKSPSLFDQTMVDELLENWKTNMRSKDINCLHSKPILTALFNITEKTKLYE